MDPGGILRWAGHALGTLIPDDCRVCRAPLRDFSRVPVCSSCLSSIEPFVAEYHCAACHAPFLNRNPLDEAGLCAMCRAGMAGFDGAFSFGHYEGTLKRLVQLFKYHRIHTLAGPLGASMVRALPRDIPIDAIVPAPLHWWRRWRRGFNQAALLAGEVARRTGLPLIEPVRRRKATAPQASLTNAQRRLNVRAAFDVRNPAAVRGKSLLLIDDVLTTGATAGSCSAALKRAGAARVTVLTVARADRRMWFPAAGKTSAKGAY